MAGAKASDSSAASAGGDHVLPVSDLHLMPGLDKVNPDLANTIGWAQLTSQVAGAYRTIAPPLRSQASVFTQTYGEAGAVAL